LVELVGEELRGGDVAVPTDRVDRDETDGEIEDVRRAAPLQSECP
jgi:hypothetical protein